MLPADIVVLGCENEKSWIGNVEEIMDSDESTEVIGGEGLDESGDLDVIERCDKGASMRKLQLSFFLSQFAQMGCLPSHWCLVSAKKNWRKLVNFEISNRAAVRVLTTLSV